MAKHLQFTEEEKPPEKSPTAPPAKKKPPKHIDKLEQKSARHHERLTDAQAAQLEVNTHRTEEGISPMVIDDKTYTDRGEAGAALLEVCKGIQTTEPTHIGSYRGFCMSRWRTPRPSFKIKRILLCFNRLVKFTKNELPMISNNSSSGKSMPKRFLISVFIVSIFFKCW